MINREKGVAEQIFVLSITLAMALLFYANSDTQNFQDGSVVNLGIGKSFYVPCLTALLSSFFIKKRADSLYVAMFCMMGIAIISTIINPPEFTSFFELTITRFIFAVLCFIRLKDIYPQLVIRYIAISSPFIVFPHYILTNPFQFGGNRYGGFYGDPNFLALALNFVIAMCYMALRFEKNRILKFFYIISIMGAIPLIMVGMSRGGILGLLFILGAILYDIWKTSKRSYILVLLVIVLGASPFYQSFSDIITLIEFRFSGESEADAGGAMARWDGVMSAVNVFSNKPELIPFGIGFGNTLTHISEYRQYGYYTRFVIHNTYAAIMYEIGVLGLMFYLYLYLYVFRNLWKMRNYFLLGLFFSAILSLMTLPGGSFMPGWILLFFLANKRLIFVSER